LSRWSVGVDTGGTFTDLAAVDHDTGDTYVTKVPSTPAQPADAILEALARFEAERGITASEVALLGHGTTVATNALLEGKGARAGLLITAGFRAVYPAQTGARPVGRDLIDPAYRKAELLIPQARTFEIVERIGAQGQIVTPLDRDGVRQAARKLAALGCTSIAICFLFAFLRNDHEREAAAIVREELPDVRVSLSSDVLPVIREYPRLSTVAVDAYVGPLVSTYFSELEERLATRGLDADSVFIMQSNGGLMRLKVAEAYPNETLLSGPAAGIAFATTLAKRTGEPNVITFDMGGTSTEACLVRGGVAASVNGGAIAGHVVGTSMIEIRTIGAGGGAIAHRGADGLLKVGPESAGAIPGPACYGRGGTQATVTDANVVLGYLDAARFLGGALHGDRALAEAALVQLAAELGVAPLEAAVGVRRVINARMAGALRLTLAQEGCDGRDFSLLAFGGSGPLHAAELADELGFREVLVPAHPGVSCAMGLLLSDVKHVFVRSAPQDLAKAVPAELDALFRELEERARAEIEREGFDAVQLDVVRQLDLRYAKQGYSLTIDVPGAIEDGTLAAIRAAFDARHEAIYGVAAPDEHAEIVTPRLIARVNLPRMPLHGAHAARRPEPLRARPAYFPERGGFIDTPVYARAALGEGMTLRGPLIVEQLDATTVIGPAHVLRVDALANLRIARAPA
jgi:N-methylhydantoinase A